MESTSYSGNYPSFNQQNLPEEPEILPNDTIGYKVDFEGSSSLAQQDLESEIEDHLSIFFRKSGLKSAPISPPQIGTTTVPESLLAAKISFKIIRFCISIYKIYAIWSETKAKMKAKEYLPKFSVTILADHMPPIWFTSTNSADSARTLCRLTPELKKYLENEFPNICFHITVLARAKNIHRVMFNYGGANVSYKEINKMMKMLDKDENLLTINHYQNGLGINQITKIPGRLDTLHPSTHIRRKEKPVPLG